MIGNYLLSLFLFAQMGQILDESPFQDFVVGIWPEYDHPGILVIYTGSIKEKYLPLLLEARVPDQTTFAFAIGQSDTMNSLQPVPIVEKNGRKWISTPLVRESFQLELYFNPFGSTEIREGEITLQLNHPLGRYHIAVQQPLAAEAFVFSEPDAETFRDEHGLQYSRSHLPSLPAGQLKTISFSYTNRNGKLSIDLLQEMLGSSPEKPSSSPGKTGGKIDRYKLPTYQPLVMLALLSIVIGFIFWKTNYKTPRFGLNKDKRSFCPNCGIKIGTDDSFCSKCGNELV